MDLAWQEPKISFQKGRLERNTHSSVKADVCDGITTFQAFYHFPRIPLCVNSAERIVIGPLQLLP